MAFAVSSLVLLMAACLAVWMLRRRLRHPPDRGDLEAAVDREARKFTRGRLRCQLVIGVYKDGRSVVLGAGPGSPGSPGSVQPLDGTTTFQIGSVSKLFTASLLQALCDEGVVTLDTRLAQALGGRWPLAPGVRAITLRQLATHTSGLASIPPALHTEFEAARRAAGHGPLEDPYSHLGPERIFGHLATAPDLQPPGRFAYSNFGMGLLGHVLEHVTGEDHEALVRRHVLEPLGMAGTRITLTPELRATLAPGHDAQGQPAGLWHFASLHGAGAWASNVQDLLTLIRASLEPGTVAASRFEAMRAPQPGGDTGLGWMQPTWLDRLFGNQGVVWHNGMVGGHAAYLSIDPATRSGTVVLASQAIDVTLLGMLLTRQARTQSWAAQSQDGTGS